MTKKLKVGVVGVGYLGQIHARIYSEMDNVELVGVSDTDEAHAKTIAEKYGCSATTNFMELVNKVDAVSIVVPTTYHFDVAQPFLEAGIPTLLEKPIAATVKEARRLVEIASQNSTPLLIGHLERYNPAWEEVYREVTEPKFNVITDLMIHDLDLVQALVDDEVVQVDAVGSKVITDHVDIANVRLQFANGVVANLTASRVSNKRIRRFRVFGPEGYMGADLADQNIEIVRPDGPKTASGFPTMQTQSLALTPEQPLQKELAHFVDVAQNSAVPLVSGWQGLQALELAEKVQRRIVLYCFKHSRIIQLLA